MRVIDSSGWLEWFTDGPVAEDYRPFLEKSGDILIPLIVVYEVYKVLKRTVSEETTLLAIGRTQQSQLVEYRASVTPPILPCVTASPWPTRWYTRRHV